MTEEQFTKVMNVRLKDLFDLYPIDDLRPIEVSEDMKDGLAKSYAHRGMRMYLENAIKVALKNMAIAATPVEISYYKSRVDVLEQLLAKGKQMFTQTSVSKEMKEVVKNGN